MIKKKLKALGEKNKYEIGGKKVESKLSLPQLDKLQKSSVLG